LQIVQNCEIESRKYCRLVMSAKYFIFGPLNLHLFKPLALLFFDFLVSFSILQVIERK
jgi:hypothetical protein